MRRRALVFACALASVLHASPVKAAGALETVSPEIGKQLGPVPAGTLVVASPVTSDVPGTVPARTDELAVRVAQLVAGQLGGTTRAHPQAATLSVARAASAKSAALVYVALEIARGELRATAELYPVMGNAWDRIRVPVPPPRAHVFARGAVDAEVRGFLPAISLEQAEVHKAKQEEGEVLAVACGESEDSGLEIALVTRSRVTVGTLQHARFVPRRSTAWTALAPRLPSSLRVPLGGADFTGGVLRVGTSDRGGVAVDSALAHPSPLYGIPVAGAADGCVAFDPASDGFGGDVASCSNTVRDLTVRFAVEAPKYDAVATFDAVAKDGKSRAVLAVREPLGKLHVRVGTDARVVEGAGAELAVGDLDLDGSPEVVVSSDAGEDSISIYTADGASDLRLRRKLPAPAGVRALAVCPPEARAVPALVAVVGSEIWLVR